VRVGFETGNACACSRCETDPKWVDNMIMSRSSSQLRSDAERIWRAGVAAVQPSRLIREHVRVDGDVLHVDEEPIQLHLVGRIAIVGAGKASGAMAVALEEVLGIRLLAEKNVTGWVNVPDDCVVPTQRVQLHAARPAGINEPRPEGVVGARRILELVGSLGPTDLCICVLSGGGSALLPAPVPEITLDDKVRVTRLLSAAGANIEQLNTVRRHLSLIKGGGLARACRAGRLITLIISDVLGDPLEAIASGPTVSSTTTASDALRVLTELKLADEPSIASLVEYLRRRSPVVEDAKPHCMVTNQIIGNNATAVDAAGIEAERLGYSHAMISAMAPEGPAEEVGQHLAEMALRMRRDAGPDCLISGGEPTVTLVEESRRGQGGRNQQLVLAAIEWLGESNGIVLLSAGTDGEDGPTNAAGAFVTEDVVRIAAERGLKPQEYLARNDAYKFFEISGGLFITGATHTNVCDLRVVLVDQSHHH
jgi:glycerate 2-kinase